MTDACDYDPVSEEGLSMNDAIHNFAAGLYFEPYAIDQLVDDSRHHEV
jgi:hypothetical protein